METQYGNNAVPFFVFLPGQRRIISLSIMSGVWPFLPPEEFENPTWIDTAGDDQMQLSA